MHNPNNSEEIFLDLMSLHLSSQGFLLKFYYKYIKKNFKIYPVSRSWEYPWAIINAHITKGLNILDAGCGGSPLLSYLYKRGCNCFGVDYKFWYDSSFPKSFKARISRKLSNYFPFYYLINPHGMYPLANAAKSLGFKIFYIKGKINNLPFKDNFFDRIFCISVLEHINRNDFCYIAKEFKRVLKRDGLLIITMDIKDSGIFWQDFIMATGMVLINKDYKDYYKDLGYSVIGLILKKT